MLVTECADCGKHLVNMSKKHLVSTLEMSSTEANWKDYNAAIQGDAKSATRIQKRIQVKF